MDEGAGWIGRSEELAPNFVHRRHVLVKSETPAGIRRALDLVRGLDAARGVDEQWDVDPVGML